MRGVVLQGTGTQANLPDIAVAGKTGTAQNPHGKDHAWFIAFAPADNPKIAITVLVENSGFGGSISAPIARELIRYYVKDNKKPLPSSIRTATKQSGPAAMQPDSLSAGTENMPTEEITPATPELPEEVIQSEPEAEQGDNEE